MIKKINTTHNLLKQVANFKKTNLNENKKHGITIWLSIVCLLFFISFFSCSPSTSSNGGDGGNQLSQELLTNVLANVYNISDNSELELDGAISVTTAKVGGTTYLFTAGHYDDGISMFSVGSDGSLNNIYNLYNNDNLRLDGVDSVTTAEVEGTTYLFTAGYLDSSIGVFRLEPDKSLSNVTNVADTSNLELENITSVTTAKVEGTTYLFTGAFNDGVSVFKVEDNGKLINVYNINRKEDRYLYAIGDITTAVVEEITYLFVGSIFSDGVSVFRVEPSGKLINVYSVGDTHNLKLDSVFSVTTAEVEGSTYLFAAGTSDDGVSVFRVEPSGRLINVYNITDDSNLELDGVSSITTAEVEGVTYLFVAGKDDDGVSVFRVEPSGRLSNIYNITDDSNLKLDEVRSITTAQVGGITYLFVAGILDNGVSVFRVNAE